MNGRGLFDRYIDGCNSNLLSEGIEEVYDFPRKADTDDIPEEVKEELTSDADKLISALKDNTPSEYSSLNEYTDLDIVEAFLVKLKKYKRYENGLSAFEKLNPRIIVKRIADSDMEARKKDEVTGEPANEEGIFTRLFNPENIDKIRQDKRIYNPSNAEHKPRVFNDFLKSRGYGTKQYSSIFRNKNFSSNDNIKQSYVAVPSPVNIKPNGKIDGSGNFVYYKITDDNKLGDKVSGPIGRFNGSYIYAGKTFTDETTNTEYYIFRRENSGDFLYGYFRDRDAGERHLSRKDIDTLIGGDSEWQKRLGNAETKHDLMVKGENRGLLKGKAVKTRENNPQLYPFLFIDYFYVKNIDDVYVCIRVVTAQSREGYRVNKQLRHRNKSTDVIYIEGYVLETPPPDVYENPADSTDFVEKVSHYIDETIAYINANNNFNKNNKTLDPRTPDYKGFVSDTNRYWVKMDSSTNATTIMINTLQAFFTLYRHMTTDFKNQKWMTAELQPMYDRANINFKQPDKNNPFGMPKKHYMNIIQYLKDFQTYFYGANWNKIPNIEEYADKDNVFFVVRRWCVRQLKILKVLFKYDITDIKTSKYIDDFRNLGEFESKYWRLQFSDVQINTTTSQDQDIMETIRHRLLEYCD